MKDFHLVKGESFVFLLLLTVNLYVKNFKLIVPRVNCLDIKKKVSSSPLHPCFPLFLSLLSLPTSLSPVCFVF